MKSKKAYAAAGVDIDLGNRVKATLPALLASTRRPGVLGKVGGFGGLFALGIRLELLTPPGDLWSPDLYNKLFTLHGVVMIFFFLIPSIPATLGNFFLPIMIGAKDLAFPRINLLSWYIYVVAGIFAVVAVVTGGVDTGWTFYVPFSERTTTNVSIAVIAVFVLGFSSILTGLNFITTVEDLAVLKRVIVQNIAPGGMAVLNAADPIVAAMVDQTRGAAVTFFALDRSSRRAYLGDA